MTAFLTLLVAGVHLAPVKPLIVVTDREPDSLDRYLVSADEAERAKAQKIRPYALRETERFVVATPPGFLGLDKAKAQSAFIGLLARRSAGGERVVSVKDLDTASATRVRDMVRTRIRTGNRPYGNPDERAADAPDLRVSLGVMTRFDLKAGSQTASVWVLPGVGNFERHDRLTKDAAMALADPSPDQKRREESNPAPVKPARSGRLTFLVPPETASGDEMEWIAEAQAILAKEAREARIEWKASRDALLRALDSDVAENLRPGAPTDRPELADLNPTARYQALSLFEQHNRRMLNGETPEGWASRAKTMRSQVDPVLTLYVLGEVGPNVTGYGLYQIPFDCPIGP